MKNLAWSEWLPLNGDVEVYKAVPTKQSGLYRIRAVGKDGLIYIGQTGRCLRGRLRALRSGVYASEMPYNDPHTAAPNLWIWLNEESYEYEFSFLLSDLDTPQRQGLEDFFLWMHRKEFGFSTLCNYGRFHKQWIKPTNKKQGRKGERLSKGNFNPSGLTSSKVLKHIGKSHDADWMGLDWSEPEVLNTVSINVLDNTPAVYRVMDSASHDVLYIGETKELLSRLKAHAKKPWNGEETLFSFAQGVDLSESHQRHEIEVDLIGAYFEEHQRVPCFQYGQLG
ncbi:hypothetical protein [Vibrio alfacsensis]|uniref:hypothetical protein n=1 Tax=Vibrio alfacsensis TaxID=1074311 RepID=UPI001CED9502|nr:hypothetical protein [Vibrio alfacsensis]